MILFEIPLVIPTRTLGLVLLLLNTVFSVLGQVSYPVSPSLSGI